MNALCPPSSAWSAVCLDSTGQYLAEYWDKEDILVNTCADLDIPIK